MTQIESARRMHDETLPQEAFKSAKFCSMRVTQDIRKLSRGPSAKSTISLATANR